MKIEIAALKRIAKATPELTIAQLVAVLEVKIENERREQERLRIAEKRQHSATTTNNEQQPPTYAQTESELYRFADQVCGKRAGSFVKTLLAANRNDVSTTRAIFERAQQTHDPRGFIASAAGKVKQNGAGNPTMAALDRVIASAKKGAGDGDGPLLDLTPESP